jgi:hypothetical protein
LLKSERVLEAVGSDAMNDDVDEYDDAVEVRMGRGEGVRRNPHNPPGRGEVPSEPPAAEPSALGGMACGEDSGVSVVTLIAGALQGSVRCGLANHDLRSCPASGFDFASSRPISSWRSCIKPRTESNSPAASVRWKVPGLSSIIS